MTPYLRLLLLVLGLALTAPAPADALQPFTARYEVEVSGLGGELVSSLSTAADGRYVFENRTTARGLARLVRPQDAVDRSEFDAVAGGLRPLKFDSHDGTRRNKRGNEVVFDWRAGSAASLYKGERRELELGNGTLDRQLMQLAMMSDLARGMTRASYRVVDRHAVKRYDVTVIGEEPVAVPAGDFSTLKVERRRPGSSRSTILWCAPELGFLPVMMQQYKDDKPIATLSLTAVD